MAADLESFFRSQNENEQRFLGNMASIIEKVKCIFKYFGTGVNRNCIY